MKDKTIYGIVGKNLVATSYTYETVVKAQTVTDNVHFKGFKSFEEAKRYVIHMFPKINEIYIEEDEVPYDDLIFFDAIKPKYYGVAGNYSLGVLSSPIAVRMYYDYFENMHIKLFDCFEDAEEFAIETFNSLQKRETFNTKLVVNYIFTQI